jgi:hypothetical protein
MRVIDGRHLALYMFLGAGGLLQQRHLGVSTCVSRSILVPVGFVNHSHTLNNTYVKRLIRLHDVNPTLA